MLTRKSCLRFAAILFIVGVCFATGFLLRRKHRKERAAQELSGTILAEFISLDPIDAHTHILQSGPAFLGMLQHLNLDVVDILYVDDTTPYLSSLETEKSEVWKFAGTSDRHVQICTTFDPFRFGEAKFTANAVAGLDQDFQDGAVAVKIWKNIGMEIKNTSGEYLMPDDPALEPIYRDIAAHDRTLISHQSDPDEAWKQLDPKDPGMRYFVAHPQWSMARAGYPDKAKILRARDHVLAMNPSLRVIGAHFGSLEQHLDELATTLDRYPNFAVDTAARLRKLVTQPRENVREFFLKYQDRILYGTDLNFYNGANDFQAARAWESQYALDWRYLSTGDNFEYEGHQTVGLNLPKEVLKKVYHDNAVRWIPGLRKSFVQSSAAQQ